MTEITSLTSEIEHIVGKLRLSDENLRNVMKCLLQEMENGLGKETNPTATVKMFPTYVREIPNGNEKGKFLAMDLGGTNFRILLIDFNGSEVKMESKIFEIPQRIKLGSGEQLFDYIAEHLVTFTTDYNLGSEKLPLGFTFSYPCKQEGLTKAQLLNWTKGFNCSGVVNEDVVDLLMQSIKKRSNVDIDVVALVNDTTGTLMSCALENHDCMIGVIVGTGTNACYMESLDKVELWTEDHNDPKQVIINIAWGAFGDNGVLDFARTVYDKNVDENSINVGQQIYEKMLSGMYMGELVRLVLVHLTEEKILFGGKASKTLLQRDTFHTKYVSKIEEDSGLNATQQVLKELGVSKATEKDCKIVKEVCRVVSTRAAHLIAAGIATLIKRINKPKITVGIDGSVYRCHPHFKNLMIEKIQQLIPDNLKFEVIPSEDGSGMGAAVVAAVAVRLKE